MIHLNSFVGANHSTVIIRYLEKLKIEIKNFYLLVVLIFNVANAAINVLSVICVLDMLVVHHHQGKSRNHQNADDNNLLDSYSTFFSFVIH